jgi:hypothetical protein
LDDKRNENRRRNNYENDKNVKQKEEDSLSDEKLVKPQSGSIFDRARPPPKISRPVPLNEKNKFAYKSTDKSVVSKEEDDYAHEYDDEISKSPTASATTTTTRTISVLSPKPFIQKLKPTITQQTTAKSITTTTISDAEYYDDEYYDTPSSTPIVESSSINTKDERIGITFKSRLRNEQYTTPTTTAASSPDSFRLNRYSSIENYNNRQQSSLIADSTAKKPQQTINAAASDGENVSKKYANKQTVFDHVTQETPPKLNTQNLFQNLYNNRNLENRQQVTKEDATQTYSFESKDAATIVTKGPFLPSRGGNPFKARGLQPVGVLAQQSTETHENINSSQQSKLDSHKITLEDLYNEEYDVDLNDALNPMLKPLTSSRGISESNNQQPIIGVSDKDAIKAQNQKAVQQNFAESAPAVAVGTTTTEQPEYYDDELEYTYADDVA